MSQVFSDYVRSLDPEPSPEAFERVLKALRRELRRELKRRGLWDSSPRYVGIFGHERWLGPEGQPDGGAMEELLFDAYHFIFIDRLENLVNHLEIKPQIEGLVRLNIRHFLHEAQKKHDPLGYRVFQILHDAVRQAIKRKTLHIAAGGPAIRNETVLSFEADADPGALPPAQLDETIHRWNDELLPAIIGARGKAREEAIIALCSRIEALREAGVEGFTFRELIDPLKNDARARWPALHGLSGEEVGFEGGGESEDAVPEVVPLVHPDTKVEEHQTVSRLVECMEEALDEAEETPTGKEYLAAVWSFLRTWISEPHIELPSRRRQAALLHIPRNRMTGLYETLQGLMERCRGATSRATVGEAAVTSSGAIEFSGLPGAASRGSSKEGAMSQPTDRLEALRRWTGEARAAIEPTRPSPRTLRAGDVYLLPATSDFPIEWAVLDAGPGIARPLLVPADAQPLVGHADCVVPSSEPGAPRTLRCGFGLRVPETAFDPQTWKRTGSLSPETLRQARQRHREASETSDLQGSADEDPEYLNWVAEVLEPAREALEAASPAEVIELRPRSASWNPLANPWPVAASVLFMVSLGALGGLWWQHRELTELRRSAVLAPPDFDIQAGERGWQRVEVSPGDSHVLLFLHAPEDGFSTRDPYRLVISRLRPRNVQEEIWRNEILAQVNTRIFLVLPADLLPSGDYYFRLEVPESGREVVTYPITVIDRKAEP